MEFYDFYLPTETGERLAFFAAVLIGLLGLFAFFAPRTALGLCGLQMREGAREGLAFVRSAGGFHAGLAIMALLVAQEWIYLAMGGGLALAAFGRVLSLMSDRSATIKNLVVLLVQAGLAFCLLAYPFGLF